MSGDLQAALRAVTLASEVERHARGVGRLKLRELAVITDGRILEAVHAGATTSDVAAALYVGRSRAEERVRRAKRAAGEPVRTYRFKAASPDLVVDDNEVVTLAPSPVPVQPADVWLEVPQCRSPLPPPAPVHARCGLAARHPGPHASRNP